MATSTLVETVGAANANTFATRAEFTQFLDDRFNAPTMTDDEKDVCLLEAAVTITRIDTWLGTRVDSTQALSWPRDYVPNPDLPTLNAAVTYYSTTVVPDR